MSDGTRDQLYIALRIGAISDYIDRAAPMPFVGDDLFVGFDDTRAKYAIEALLEASKSHQVILFTHHAHFVELAKQVLSSDANVVMLD